MIGALAQSLGTAAEAAVVWFVIRETAKMEGKIPGPPLSAAGNTKELSENA